MNAPPLKGHAGRPTTRAAQRRFLNRLASSMNSPQSDVINPTGNAAGGHAVRLLGDGTQLLSNAATILNWTSAPTNTDAWWTSGTDVTVTFAGIYMISATITPLYGGTPASGQWTLEVLKNASASMVVTGFFDMTAAIVTCLVASTTRQLAVGDVVSLRATENSGTSFFVDASNSEFNVALLGTV